MSNVRITIYVQLPYVDYGGAAASYESGYFYKRLWVIRDCHNVTAPPVMVRKIKPQRTQRITESCYFFSFAHNWGLCRSRTNPNTGSTTGRPHTSSSANTVRNNASGRTSGADRVCGSLSLTLSLSLSLTQSRNCTSSCPSLQARIALYRSPVP